MIHKLRASALIVAALLTVGSSGLAADSRMAPDDSGANKRENVGGTADQQSNDKRDEQIIRKIRSTLMADHNLSSYAHNVKILAQNGNVTLKGPVRSEAEKDKIQGKAEAVAGKDRVTNELEIAPK